MEQWLAIRAAHSGTNMRVTYIYMIYIYIYMSLHTWYKLMFSLEVDGYLRIVLEYLLY